MGMRSRRGWPGMGGMTGLWMLRIKAAERLDQS